MQRGRPRSESAGSMGRLGLALGLRDSRCIYGESTAALISKIGRRITEATGESRETLWLEQRFGLAVQRGNVLSILTAVRKKYDVELGTR